MPSFPLLHCSPLLHLQFFSKVLTYEKDVEGPQAGGLLWMLLYLEVMGSKETCTDLFF